MGARRYGVVTRGQAQMSRDNPSRQYQDGDAEGSSAGNDEGQEVSQFGNAMVVVVLDTTRGNARD